MRDIMKTLKTLLALSMLVAPAASFAMDPNLAEQAGGPDLANQAGDRICKAVISVADFFSPKENAYRWAQRIVKTDKDGNTVTEGKIADKREKAARWVANHPNLIGAPIALGKLVIIPAAAYCGYRLTRFACDKAPAAFAWATAKVFAAASAAKSLVTGNKPAAHDAAATPAAPAAQPAAKKPAQKPAA